MATEFDDDQTQRRFMRVPPDDLEVAHLCFDLGLTEDRFVPQVVGIVIEENVLGGCGICVRMREDFRLRRLQIGDRCLIRLANLAPMVAEVRWRRQLDEAVLRVGFAFLD